VSTEDRALNRRGSQTVPADFDGLWFVSDVQGCFASLLMHIVVASTFMVEAGGPLRSVIRPEKSSSEEQGSSC
jgi:hypothetical protein